MKFFRQIKAALRLFEAVRQANKSHKRTGDRYYVLKTTGKTGQLIIMDRVGFRKLKHKRYIAQTVTISNLEKECFYCTPYKNGEGALPISIQNMKRKMYFEWVESLRK